MRIPCGILLLLAHRPYLDIYLWGEVELGERIDRVGRSRHDVEHPRVDTHFKLLTRVLVNVRGAQHGVFFDVRGKWHWSADVRACAFDRLDYVADRAIKHSVVVCFEFEPNSFHILSFKRTFNA